MIKGNLLGAAIVCTFIGSVTSYAGDDEALIQAATLGHHEVVTTLLAQGADVDATNNEGQTALMLASMMGHRPVVTTLLAQGAEVNAKASDGSTALTWASERGSRKVVQLLKSAGATEWFTEPVPYTTS